MRLVSCVFVCLIAIGCGKEPEPPEEPEKHPPVAQAGSDQVVHKGQAVTLDGAASTDPDGDAITYAWTQIEGLVAPLSDPAAEKPTFTAPAETGTLVFSLVVSDGELTSEADLVEIAVENQAPVADAGDDQSVDKAEVVTLAGAATDPDGEAVTLAWTQTGGPAVTLSDPAAATPTFTAPPTGGPLTFELAASDGEQAGTDAVTVTVVNRLPVADAGPDQLVQKRSEVALDGSASSDPDGDPLSYVWIQVGGPTITLDDASAAKPTFTAPEVPGTIVLNLVVSDGEASSPSDVVEITMENVAPVATAGPDATAKKGETVVLAGTASDPDGDPLTFSWSQVSGPAVTLEAADTLAATFEAPANAGDVVLRLSVTDQGAVVTDEVTVTVTNEAPTAVAAGPVEVNKKAEVVLDGSGSSDPEGDGLTFAWTQASGPPVTGLDAGAVKPTFSAPTTSGAMVFELVVTDHDGAASETASVTVTVLNLAPMANAGPAQAVDKKETVTLDGSGSTDPDGDPITYAWTAPDGIVLSDATAAKPTFVAPTEGGPIELSLVVRDSEQATSEASTVVVTVENKVPDAVATGTAGPIHKGDLVTLDASASTDPDGDELDFLWTQVADEAPRVTLSSATAASPTFDAPLESGPIAFSVIVSDGEGSSTASVTVTVVNRAPTAKILVDTNVPKRAKVVLDGSGSDDLDPDALTYVWKQKVEEGDAAITVAEPGEPETSFQSPDVGGTVTIQLTVSDGEDSDTAEVVVRVENQVPVADAGEAPAPVYKGATFTLSGSGTDGDALDQLTPTWSQPEGAPAKRLLSEDPWHPSYEAPLVSGAMTFQLTVSDGELPAATDTVLVTVVNRAPVANAGPDQLTVRKRALVTLQGSGSDPDTEDPFLVSWTPLPGTSVTLSGPDTLKPTFEAPDVSGTLGFELSISDGETTDTDTVFVTVTNAAPTANAGLDLQVYKRDHPVTLTGSGGDDDGDPITYQWTQTGGEPTVALTGAATAAPTFTAPAVTTDLEFELVVADNESSGSDRVVVHVGNRAPKANAGPDQTVARGATVALDGTKSTDPDGDGLTYAWSAEPPVVFTEIAPGQATFPAPATEGTVLVTLLVTDEDGLKSEDVVVITVDNQVPTAKVVVLPDKPAVLSQVTLDGSGSSDPDGDTLTWEWVQLEGPTVEVSGASTSTATFEAPWRSSDLLRFRLTVSDGTDSDLLEVLVPLVNEAPTAHAGEDALVDGGELVWLDATGSVDPEGSRLAYRWTQVGGDLTVPMADPTSSLLPIVVPEGGGEFAFEVAVDDGESLDTDVVELSVRPWQGQPLWTDVVNPFGEEEGGRISFSEQRELRQGDLGLLHLSTIGEAGVRTPVASSQEPAPPLLAHYADLAICGGFVAEGLTLEAWGLKGGEVLLPLAQRSVPGTAFGETVFSPDGQRLFVTVSSGSRDGKEVWTLLVFDVAEGKLSLIGSSDFALGQRVEGLTAASAARAWLAMSGLPEGGNLVRVDVEAPNVKLQQAVEVCGSLNDVSWSDGLLYGACDTGLVVLDPADPSTPVGSLDLARGTAVSAGEGTALVGGPATAIYEVDVRSSEAPALAGVHFGPRMAYGPILPIATDGFGVFWRTEGGFFRTDLGGAMPLPPEKPFAGDPTAMFTGADLLLLGATGQTRVFDVFDPVGPALLDSLEVSAAPLGYGILSPWTGLAASGGSIHTFDVGTGEVTLLHKVEDTYDSVQVFDTQVVAASETGLVAVDLVKGLRRDLYIGSPALAVARRGATVWAGFSNGLLQGWDLENPDKPLQTLDAQLVERGPLVSFDHALVAARTTEDLAVWTATAEGVSDVALVDYVPPLGTSRSLAGTGSILAVPTDGGLDVWSLSKPLDPVLVGHHATAGRADAVVTGAGHAFVRNADGQEISILALQPAAFDQRYVDVEGLESLGYEVRWPVDGTVSCHATAGVVVVEESTSTSAKVSWKLPQEGGAHELVCAAGADHAFTILRDRISLGER